MWTEKVGNEYGNNHSNHHNIHDINIASIFCILFMIHTYKYLLHACHYFHQNNFKCHFKKSRANFTWPSISPILSLEFLVKTLLKVYVLSFILCEHVYWLLVAGVGEENPPGRDLTQVHPITTCWHAGHCWTYYSQRKYYWVDISSAVLNKHVHIIEGEYLEARKFVFEHSQRLETKIFLLSVLNWLNAYDSFNAYFSLYRNELFIVSKMSHKARTCHSDTYIVL